MQRPALFKKETVNNHCNQILENNHNTIFITEFIPNYKFMELRIKCPNIQTSSYMLTAARILYARHWKVIHTAKKI